MGSTNVIITDPLPSAERTPNPYMRMQSAPSNGEAMNERLQAMIEALMWVEYMLEEARNRPDGVERVLREVREAMDDIKRGVAVDFRARLRSFY